MAPISFAVITVSDTCANGMAIDSSGVNLQSLIKGKFADAIIKYEIVPDDLNKIEGALKFFSDVLNINIILTTGGTGFSSRDVTPEATRKLIEKETPQLTLAMSLCSFKKTKYAALSRAVSGIRKNSLIINFPGSRKASTECFESISDILYHAVEVITDEKRCIRETHKIVQGLNAPSTHVCPHKTGTGLKDDRNSPFPMISVSNALDIVFKTVILNSSENKFLVKSTMDLPPFRASIKDGYALKSTGKVGQKKVLGYMSAGDKIITTDFNDDECYKINTGAAVPDAADCIIQVEDTKLIQEENGVEKLIEIFTEPKANLDIRPRGLDLQKNENLFGDISYNPGEVVYKSLLASIGQIGGIQQPTIGIISTGDELFEPGKPLESGKIYDTNTTMLRQLLVQFGFTNIRSSIVADKYESLFNVMKSMQENCQIIISTGGVSMGDKDFIKTVLKDLNIEIRFGRVNMKPGKPMTFASNGKSSVFGLPGNPVSAFVCFHLFVLPALRQISNYNPEKLSLSIIEVVLNNDKIELDPRPEYARATVVSRNGKLYAEITGNQISSRLKSICGADVLIHLPGATAEQKFIEKGTVLKASVLKHDFISKYE